MDSIGTADGSAIVKVGNTTAVCGIKAELARPTPNNPEHGIVVPNIELTPACSPKIRPGAPSEEAQVATRMLTELLSNSECLDLAELCVVRERLVWVLYCDIVCLDHDGSLLDVAAIALIAALKGRTFHFRSIIHIPDKLSWRVSHFLQWDFLLLSTTPIRTFTESTSPSNKRSTWKQRPWQHHSWYLMSKLFYSIYILLVIIFINIQIYRFF